MKQLAAGFFVVAALLLTSCGSQCPVGYNVSDPSCPGFNPYASQQPFQTQPYYQPGTYPLPNQFAQPGVVPPPQYPAQYNSPYQGIPPYPYQPGMPPGGYPPFPNQPIYR